MKALILGVSGQDGAYLSQLLLQKGYKVYGSSRNARTNKFEKLKKLNIKKKINIITLDINNFKNLLKLIKNIKPDEIYNLSGQSSVSASFNKPFETLKSISNTTLNILEAIRFLNPDIRFYNASSSDCFGDTGKNPANEETSFNPCSPYGVAKASAHLLVKNYREGYGLHLSNGILFNHESPLRPLHFVSQKIAYSAARINAGSKEKLKLGNLSISRDWGWAPEYVNAMWLMLQQPKADDYIIATKKTITLEKFVSKIFNYYKLNWKNYVDIDNSFLRPSDIKVSKGNPSKAKKKLGWIAKKDVYDVIDKLCFYAKKNIKY